MNPTPIGEQFLGCLLGQAVADAVGAPYEGLPADMIFQEFGPPDVLLQNSSGETLFYTDDTQMMIGVAEVLAEHGRIVEEALVAAFVANYHPDRGYGQGARKIIGAMSDGEDSRAVRASVFPGRYCISPRAGGNPIRSRPPGIESFEKIKKGIDRAGGV